MTRPPKYEHRFDVFVTAEMHEAVKASSSAMNLPQATIVRLALYRYLVAEGFWTSPRPQGTGGYDTPRG